MKCAQEHFEEGRESKVHFPPLILIKVIIKAKRKI